MTPYSFKNPTVLVDLEQDEATRYKAGATLVIRIEDIPCQDASLAKTLGTGRVLKSIRITTSGLNIATHDGYRLLRCSDNSFAER